MSGSYRIRKVKPDFWTKTSHSYFSSSAVLSNEVTVDRTDSSVRNLVVKDDPEIWRCIIETCFVGKWYDIVDFHLCRLHIIFVTIILDLWTRSFVTVYQTVVHYKMEILSMVGSLIELYSLNNHTMNLCVYISIKGV